MGVLLAFAVGYVIGARAGSQDFDDVVKAVNEIRQSEEFNGFLSALRSHVSHTLRDVANVIDETRVESVNSQDLVDHVKQLIRRQLPAG
ncbi:MAG TPA: hypothetical protein VNY84_10020 [Acidimicrobiales bacterium]|nr:hypothetical protein [Acidimicrobiales bacterium]